MDFELAPRAGTTLANRKMELDTNRFVAVRNLANKYYKNPDGTPLMSYNDTLQDRESVKQKILAFELANNYILNDGTSLGATPQMSQPTGPQMTMQPPQNGMAFVPAQPMATAPVMPQIMSPVPAPVVPVQAQLFPSVITIAPTQGTSPVQPWQGQPAPEVAAVPKASRKKQNAQAGGAVAPPPLPPQTMPTAIPPMDGNVLFNTPAFPTAAPQFTGMVFTPPGEMAPPAQVAPTQSTQPDFVNAMMDRIQKLGEGAQVTINNVDAIATMVNNIHATQQAMMVALNHIYVSAVDKTAPKSVGEFVNHMAKFLKAP